MLKYAEPTLTEMSIMKGILDGFSEVTDIKNIDKFNAEVRRLFNHIKTDSEGLGDHSLYQIAFHMSKNRAEYLIANKKKKEVELPKQQFVQPIIKRKKDEPVKSETKEVETPIHAEPVTEIPEATSIPVEKVKTESNESVIKRAIFDAFNYVGNLTEATTLEHIQDESNKLFLWYKEKSNRYNSIHELYEDVFRSAKKVADSISSAHQILVEKETRKDMRAKKREEDEKSEIERHRISEVSKIELKELIAKILAEQPLSEVAKEALRYFKLIYLDDKKDPEVVHLFPGTSRDQRYQWKSRAVRLIAPYASEDARKYISEKTKRKYASTNILLKAAEMFLAHCEG